MVTKILNRSSHFYSGIEVLRPCILLVCGTACQNKNTGGSIIDAIS